MSELIPNLDDLRIQVPPGEDTTDTSEFLAELATAASVDEVTRRVDALIDRWLEVPNDRIA